MSPLRRMRTAAVLVAAMTVAGAFAPRASPDLYGRYRLARINGQALPARVGQVSVDGGSLALRPDGRFRMVFQARIPGRSGTPKFTGTWRAEADSMFMLSGTPGASSEMSYRWTLHGDTLRLYDSEHDEYAFARDSTS